MRLYKVKALSVGGTRNRIFSSGQIVKETDFIPDRADLLVKQGFLSVYDEDEYVFAPQKVSVIMNTVNEHIPYLVKSIDSYLNQKDAIVELIISTVEGDKNIDFIKQKYPQAKIVTIPYEDHPISKGEKSPLGSFMQLNNGFKHMTGDWFLFASSNDWAYPNKLALETACCLKNKKEVCYSAYDYVDDDGNKLRTQSFHDYDWEKHWHGNFVADCSMISRRIVDKYLPFRTEFKNYAYWDLWLRVREGEGNVFCYNPVPTWGYRQDVNSMHVNRWKNPEAMKLAEADKNVMLDWHKERIAKKKDEKIITVGLPVYASEIVWLAMESLCRQSTSYKWELIVYEDEFSPNGEAFYNQYFERLKSAGCIRLIYKYSKKRIALSVKWKAIAGWADNDCIGIILQAGDCYSEPQRIQTAFDKMLQGYDWIHSKRGIFYNVDVKKTALFDIGACRTGLNMCMSKSLATQLPDDERWSGVDNWILSSFKKLKRGFKIYLDESDNWRHGVDTDGYNRISLGRKSIIIDPAPPFQKTYITIGQCIPANVLQMLNDFKPSNKLKVLNICTNDWANFAYDNAMALRSVGVEATCMKMQTHKFSYEKQAQVVNIGDIIAAIKDFDYIQYFFSLNLYERIKDHLKDKRVIVWYACSDFRSNKEHYINTFNQVVYKSVIALGEFAGHGAINETYFVGAVDTEKIKPVNKKIKGAYKIAHFPSNAEVKGSATINKMMQQVKSIAPERFEFKYSESKVSFNDSLKRMSECDIYIELFSPSIGSNKYGSFGISALEAAALGKIIVTQNLSREVYESNYGECPFVLCDTEYDFISKMQMLINMNPGEIKALQDKTREWVVKNHSYEATGKRLIEKVLC
jgi:glycosyltransferase involved in cell wall biosynthesis